MALFTTPHSVQSTGSDRELLYWEIIPEEAMNNHEDTSKFFRPQQYAHPFLLRDMEWHTWTCMYGWPVMGIWPPDIAENDSVKGVMRNYHGDVLLVSDTNARVRMMRWPSLPGDRAREYFGHAYFASDAKFSADDSTVISIGGSDCTIIQWMHKNAHNGRTMTYNKATTPRRPTVVRSPKSGRKTSVRQRRTLAQITSPTEASGGKFTDSPPPIREEEGEKEKKEERRMSKAKQVSRKASAATNGKAKVSKPKPPEKKKKKEAKTFPRKVKALYDYAGDDDEELAFKEGDVILVESVDDGWFSGTLKGSSGILPQNYVED